MDLLKLNSSREILTQLIFHSPAWGTVGSALTGQSGYFEPLEVLKAKHAILRTLSDRWTWCSSSVFPTVTLLCHIPPLTKRPFSFLLFGADKILNTILTEPLHLNYNHMNCGIMMIIRMCRIYSQAMATYLVLRYQCSINFIITNIITYHFIDSYCLSLYYNCFIISSFFSRLLIIT